MTELLGSYIPIAIFIGIALVIGIAGAVLQELWEISGGDADRLREGWGTWVEGFIASVEEDSAAAAEANP